MTQIKPTLFVCTNCPNERKAGPCTLSATEGTNLLASLQQAVAAHPRLAGAITVAGVKCMGGCDTPVSVAFTGEGKEHLLFSHQHNGNVADILACMEAYLATPQGQRLGKPERPESMRDTLLVRIPAPTSQP